MSEREEILTLISEARANGARLTAACDLLDVTAKTVQRWMKEPDKHDGRKENRFPVSNALSREERKQVVDIACSREHCDRSPNQIVPILAEQGVYVASERTFYRVLGQENLLKHRSRGKTPERHKPDELVATAPNQVWTWDISYLLTMVRGVYLYLYVMLDIYDRSMVGWAVHESESGVHAAALLREACLRHDILPGQITLHQDNGGPMISVELMTALMEYGKASYSRPGVSDDNPFSESMFRTVKYRSNYPVRFADAATARLHIEQFEHWYHHEHRHSGIKFVTPMQCRTGEHLDILRKRTQTYETAKSIHPRRWSRNVRNWEPITAVYLNPTNKKEKSGRKRIA